MMGFATETATASTPNYAAASLELRAPTPASSHPLRGWQPALDTCLRNGSEVDLRIRRFAYMPEPDNTRRDSMLRSMNDDPEAVLARALDGALGVLGAQVREAIYTRLEREFGVWRRQLLRDPPVLVRGLQFIFGSTFGTIEYLVRRTLEAEFAIRIAEGSSLLDMLKNLKQHERPSLWR